jgi:hypothetical protein
MDGFAVAWQVLQGILFLVGLVLLVGAPFLLLACVVGMREKLLVWPYEPCAADQAPPQTDYAALMDKMAVEQGFQFVACTRHGKGKLYKVRYDLWLSPDHEVFAVVGSGTIARLPLQATWLFTRLVDGRVLVTVDDTAGVTSDLTGQWSYAVLLHADFPELLQRHRARVAAEITPVEPYSEEDPLADHVAMRAAQADQLERMGCATFLDDERMVYRLTPKGALIRVFQTYTKQWGQVLRNLGRRELNRPGQMGYLASDRGHTRKVLRYAELVCVATLLVDAVLLFVRRTATREQLLLQIAVGAVAMCGIFAVRASRWWLSWRQGVASGVPFTGPLRRLAIGAIFLAAGIGFGFWRAQERRAERDAALAKLMAAMPKQIQSDVSLAELKEATQDVPRFRYIGSDEKKHHFIDTSRRRIIRIFRVDRNEWTPPKVLAEDEDESYVVGFRDGKLVALNAGQPEGIDGDLDMDDGP